MSRVDARDFVDDDESMPRQEAIDNNVDISDTNGKSKASKFTRSKDKVMGDLELIALGSSKGLDIQLESLRRDYEKMSKAQKVTIIL